MICVEVPFATPSNNVVMRMHHRERSAEHKRYYWLVMADTCKLTTKNIKHCVVTVTRHGARGLDWDNFAGGLKFLFDALVKNNIIKDDNPKCITELHLKQVKCKRDDEKTVVAIEY